MISRYFRSISPQLLTLLALTVVFTVALLAGYSPVGSDSLLLGGAALIGNMTPGQARVVDPVLTEVARGYRNAEMIGHHLFPYVPVGQRGGQVIEFNKESFRLYATGRAPGADVKTVQFGHFGAPYALEQHALAGLVPIEVQDEAAAVPGIDMGSAAVQSVQDIIALRLEKQQADIARNAASYGANNKLALSGADKWSDPSSKPSNDINAAVEQIRSQIGRRPDVVELSATVFAALKEHPAILERIKYTGRDSVTPDLLAALWDVKRVAVGDAIYLGADGQLADVWGGDVVIAFTQKAGVVNRGLPSYGFTYRLRSYPNVTVPYWDNSKMSWVYPVVDEVKPVLAGADAGFLIQGAV